MTAPVPGNEIVEIDRSVLAAASYIIRKSEHAESNTAKAIRDASLKKSPAQRQANYRKRQEEKMRRYEIALSTILQHVYAPAVVSLAQEALNPSEVV